MKHNQVVLSEANAVFCNDESDIDCVKFVSRLYENSII